MALPPWNVPKVAVAVLALAIVGMGFGAHVHGFVLRDGATAAGRGFDGAPYGKDHMHAVLEAQDEYVAVVIQRFESEVSWDRRALLAPMLAPR